MNGLIFGLCALFGVAGTAHALREVWRQRRRTEYRIARIARIVAASASTVGASFAIPAVAGMIESAIGMDNVAKLAAHVCFVVACGSIQLMLVDWSYTSEALTASLYARIALGLCVLAAMITLFVASTDESIEFTMQYAAVPDVAAYYLAYLAYVAITCCEITYLCSGMAVSAQRSGHVLSARGLGMSAASAILGIAFTASKGSYLVTRYLGRPWSLRAEEIVSPMLGGLALITFTTGLILAMAGRRVPPEKVSASALA
ncbi:hypothetical protein [Streptomyces sp. NPDC086787]|uniref:hypothetical protein n=1 Tax=Streptomyces sp. NPDC086787 TaxID=3365759 RepID=UPI0038265A7C